MAGVSSVKSSVAITDLTALAGNFSCRELVFRQPWIDRVRGRRVFIVGYPQLPGTYAPESAMAQVDLGRTSPCDDSLEDRQEARALDRFRRTVAGWES